MIYRFSRCLRMTLSSKTPGMIHLTASTTTGFATQDTTAWPPLCMSVLTFHCSLIIRVRNSSLLSPSSILCTFPDS